MIKDVKSGNFDTKTLENGIHILHLEDKTYRWAHPDAVGMLELMPAIPEKTTIISNKIYRLFEVQNEPQYSCVKHLELIYNNRKMQGYLLPAGLPKRLRDPKLIIPTDELIVKRFSLETIIARLHTLYGYNVKPAYMLLCRPK